MTALPLQFPASMPDLPRWLPRAVELALSLVLLALVARVLLHAFNPALPGVPAPASAKGPVGPAAIPAVDLFYRLPGEGAANAGSVDGLVLHGIRGGTSPSAILAGADGVQRAWTVGSEPAPGVVLDSVGRDQVALRRADGTTVQLQLERRASPSPSLVRPPAQRQTASTGAGTATATPEVPTATATVTAERRTPAAPAASPSSPSPAGYRLGSEAERLPLRLAGLRPGDEILSINGQAVGGDPAALRERLAGQTRFELRYRREGRMHTATVGLP